MRRRPPKPFGGMNLRPGRSEISMLGVGRREIEVDIRPFGRERESPLERHHGFETASLAPQQLREHVVAVRAVRILFDGVLQIADGCPHIAPGQSEISETGEHAGMPGLDLESPVEQPAGFRQITSLAQHAPEVDERAHMTGLSRERFAILRLRLLETRLPRQVVGEVVIEVGLLGAEGDRAPRERLCTGRLSASTVRF